MKKQSTESPTESEWQGFGPGVAALIYFGLSVLYFLPGFLPGNHLYGSDYLAAGYFSHEFISEQLAAGSLPKWVPHIYGGVPWFANPGSTFYPFRFVVDLLFAPHRIFAAFYVIQFALAGFGTYLLSRELDVRRWVAFVGGLAFMFTGLIMSYVLGGHEGRIIVATFTPLFLFFLHRGVRTGALIWFSGAALVLGFSLLSFQIQSNYYLLLLGLAWGIFAIVQTGVRGAGAIAGRLGLGMGAVAAGFLLAAINFLPFLNYVDYSPRGGEGRGYEYATSWDMPPEEITGLVLPEHMGLLELYRGGNPFKLHTEYVGVFVFLLAALGAYYSRRDRYWWFFLAAALVGLTFSFGGHTPIYRIYYELLPGTARFRAPSISFFMVSFALVVMATLALEALATARAGASGGLGGGGRRSGTRHLRDVRGAARGGDLPEGRGPGAPASTDLRPATWVLAGAATLTFVILLLSAGGGDPHGRALAQGAFRLFAFTALVAGGLWAWLRGQLATPVLAIGLAVVTVADLWIVDRKYIETVDPPDVMMAPDLVADFLRGQPERSRVWVIPDGVAGQRAYGGGLKNYLMRFDVDQAGGEHGNQLQSYNEYLGAGQGTYVDWQNFLADLQGLIDPTVPGAHEKPNFLAAANIRYVVSTTLLPGLPEAFRGRNGVVYEVPQALPRAWLVDRAVVAAEPDGALEILADPGFDPSRSVVLYDDPPVALASQPLGDGAGQARLVRYEPDRLVIRTDAAAPALLVVADNYYPGWQATVDGEPAEVLRANHTFRAVPVGAGSQEVELRFRLPEFYTGAWISLVTFLGLVAIAALAAWRHWRPRTGAGDRETEPA